MPVVQIVAIIFKLEFKVHQIWWRRAHYFRNTYRKKRVK